MNVFKVICFRDCFIQLFFFSPDNETTVLLFFFLIWSYFEQIFTSLDTTEDNRSSSSIKASISKPCAIILIKVQSNFIRLWNSCSCIKDSATDILGKSLIKRSNFKYISMPHVISLNLTC